MVLMELMVTHAVLLRDCHQLRSNASGMGTALISEAAPVDPPTETQCSNLWNNRPGERRILDLTTGREWSEYADGRIRVVGVRWRVMINCHMQQEGSKTCSPMTGSRRIADAAGDSPARRANCVRSLFARALMGRAG
jgi:hypothetical protein